MSARWVGVVMLVATLAGCSGAPSLDPVPTAAAAPFLCDGVPQAGMALALGGPVKATQDVGAWGGEGFEEFDCTVEPSPNGPGVVFVTNEDMRVVVMDGDEERQRASLKSQANPAPIHADADGWGYVVGTGHGQTAGWVCNGRYISVEVDANVEGRDQRADAQALLVSMLPWACGHQKPPERTVGK